MAASRFLVEGEFGPDTLLRALALFAQLGLTPSEVRWRRRRRAATLRIVQDDLSPDRARILAEKMRALVTVTSVELTLPALDDPA